VGNWVFILKGFEFYGLGPGRDHNMGRAYCQLSVTNCNNITNSLNVGVSS